MFDAPTGQPALAVAQIFGLLATLFYGSLIDKYHADTGKLLLASDVLSKRDKPPAEPSGAP